MKPEIKERWLKALRSGEYKQGQQLLKDTEERFCCLGVLCDLYAKEFGIEWKVGGTGLPLFLDNNYFLPKEVVEWAGTGRIDGGLLRVPMKDGGYADKNLAELNDLHGKSFGEIADLIEEQL